jgi:hypothetical protein
VETIEQVSDVRNSDIVLNPELLADFANCKYKAAKRIAFPSCPNSPSEIEAIQKYQQGLLKERWLSTTHDGYETFNGTLCSSADFRKLSIHVFGSVRLIYNKTIKGRRPLNIVIEDRRNGAARRTVDFS